MLPLFSDSTAGREQRRVEALTTLGAREADLPALLGYTRNAFEMPAGRPVSLPLPSEPSAEDWRRYAAEAKQHGAFSVLRDRLVQLRFPIRAGIADTDAYHRATRSLDVTDVRNVPVVDGGLDLQAADRLRIDIHTTVAGDVPVVIAGTREDFVALFRALLKKNEPADVPDALGAVMISGYPNWSRLHEYRERTAPSPGEPGEALTASWPARFRTRGPDSSIYTDRFILLSPTPYSAVPATDIGMAPAAWREASIAIRRAHEAAHYITRRLLGSMRNVLHDELIADYMGITAVKPRFRADWFLRFLGLEDAPAFRETGRLSAYRGQPPLAAPAFDVVKQLAVSAARVVEAVDAERDARDPHGRIRMMLALAALSVDELAAPDGPDRLVAALDDMRPAVQFSSVAADAPPTEPITSPQK